MWPSVRAARSIKYLKFNLRLKMRMKRNEKEKKKSTINQRKQQMRKRAHTRSSEKAERARRDRETMLVECMNMCIKRRKITKLHEILTQFTIYRKQKKNAHTREEDCAKIFLANFQRKMHSIKMRCTHDVPVCWCVCNSALTRKHTHTQTPNKRLQTKGNNTEKYVTNLECSVRLWFGFRGNIFPFGPLLSIAMNRKIEENERENSVPTVCLRVCARAQECMATKNSAFHFVFRRGSCCFSLAPALSLSIALLGPLSLPHYFVRCRLLCIIFVLSWFPSREKKPSDKLFMTYEHNGIHDSNIPNTYR